MSELLKEKKEGKVNLKYAVGFSFALLSAVIGLLIFFLLGDSETTEKQSDAEDDNHREALLDSSSISGGGDVGESSGNQSNSSHGHGQKAINMQVQVGRDLNESQKQKPEVSREGTLPNEQPTEGGKAPRTKPPLNSSQNPNSNEQLNPNPNREQIPSGGSLISNTAQPNSAKSKIEALPSYLLPKLPEKATPVINELISCVDNSAKFEAKLEEYRNSVDFDPTKAVDGLNKVNYADKQLEKHLKTEIAQKIIQGDADAVQASLEKYHKIIGKTSTGATVPTSIDEIADIKVYQVANKCINTGNITREEKEDLQAALQSPQQLLSMKELDGNILGNKIEGLSEEQAVNTIKAYFCGSSEMKEKFSDYAWQAWWLKMKENFTKNKGMLANIRPRFNELARSLPNEIRDEVFYREDSKPMFEKLLSKVAPSTELLATVRSRAIPSEKIISDAFSLLRADDVALKTQFINLLIEYIRLIGYEKAQANKNFDVNTVGSVLNFCEKLNVKYARLPQAYPKDQRITDLQEWKSYVNGPTNLLNAKKLFKAISDLGIDPQVIYDYVALNCKLYEVGWGAKAHSSYFADSYLQLFRYRFPQEHPYTGMKNALFEANDSGFKAALSSFGNIPSNKMSAEEKSLEEKLHYADLI